MRLTVNLNAVFLNLNIFVLYMSNFYECKRTYSNYTEEFINLAVISDYVYIGGKNSLLQLNSSLDIVNIKPTKGSNWLLTPYKTEIKETILIACDHKEGYTTECNGYRSNFSKVDRYQRSHIEIKKPHVRYTTTTIGSDSILTIASSDCLRHFNRPDVCFAISNYKHEIDYYEKGAYTVKYWNTTQKTKFSFDFRTVVGNGHYTYFLFVLNHTASKLGKICTDSNTINAARNAYEDIPIFCSHNGVNFTTAQDLMFWNDDLLVVFTDGSVSVVCRFTNLYDNFEISRIERLKCRGRQPNKYFFTDMKWCYDEPMKNCTSSISTDVSIVLGLC